ncbi:cell division protein ZipA [Aestuariibacter sp. GS-14]|uniref:cell division protein ZipA n=1 Tax=Aestuariibacter sp. GS-14 TaxID=2590670 RepID=UPI00112A7777|nr:cell division protein ZipA [Aestuariibacter sp. GS-14]TPV61044.1 cell division protein ZipA [Aestuariibacter sp. GS-14]
MEDELRWSLLLLGGFFIIGVLAHGLWNIRKNNKAKKPPRVEPQDWQVDESDDDPDSSEQFDEYGIGSVRVVSGEKPSSQAPSVHASEDEDSVLLEPDGADDDTGNQSESPEKTRTVVAQEPPVAPKVEKIYASVVSNPKPQFGTKEATADNIDVMPAPPSFLLKGEQAAAKPKAQAESDDKSEPAIDFSLDAPLGPDARQQRTAAQDDKVEIAVESASVEKNTLRKKVKPTVRRRQEPNFGDDEQMQINFDDAQKSAQSHSAKASPGNANVDQEVLILNVRAPEDAPISGAALLPMLLTLGFKFGDQDIFHRHVNSNGKGPVLFSLANMFKPGNFDIDNLENFTTRGVSLFMLLPIEGDPHQVFNMMHNAARKIADEFNAQVLDGRRSVLTKQGLQQYVEKIRDFERKRMIARH